MYSFVANPRAESICVLEFCRDGTRCKPVAPGEILTSCKRNQYVYFIGLEREV
jgi:hypothetical protein